MPAGHGVGFTEEGGQKKPAGQRVRIPEVQKKEGGHDKQATDKGRILLTTLYCAGGHATVACENRNSNPIAPPAVFRTVTVILLEPAKSVNLNEYKREKQAFEHASRTAPLTPNMLPKTSSALHCPSKVMLYGAGVKTVRNAYHALGNDKLPMKAALGEVA